MNCKYLRNDYKISMESFNGFKHKIRVVFYTYVLLSNKTFFTGTGNYYSENCSIFFA